MNAPFDNTKFLAALNKLWPQGDVRIPGLRLAMSQQAPVLFAQYKLLDAVAVANFMGEMTEECGGGTEVYENLNYRASVLVSQWPQHFTWETAVACQHNPRLIADRAYNGRMGNRINTDDGYDFRGTGGTQLTGREPFQKLSDLLGLDLVNHPELINTTENFLKVALADFVVICGCLPFAERDDEVNETRHLNGGLIGFAQRKASIHLWEREFGVAA